MEIDASLWMPSAIAVVGVAVGGMSTYLATRQQLNHSLSLDRLQRDDAAKAAKEESERQAAHEKRQALISLLTAASQAVAAVEVASSTRAWDPTDLATTIQIFAASIGAASIAESGNYEVSGKAHELARSLSAATRGMTSNVGHVHLPDDQLEQIRDLLRSLENAVRADIGR